MWLRIWPTFRFKNDDKLLSYGMAIDPLAVMAFHCQWAGTGCWEAHPRAASTFSWVYAYLAGAWGLPGINPFLQAAKLQSPHSLQNEPLRLWEACDSGTQWGADSGPLEAGECFWGFLTWGFLSSSPLDGPKLE